MGRGDGIGELPEVERTGIAIGPETSRERQERRAYERKRKVCQAEAHDWEGTPEKPSRKYDLATVLVTITAPEEAAEANPPLRLCHACASNECKSLLGFGWFVHADPLT